MKRASFSKRLLALSLSVMLLGQGVGVLAAQEQGPKEPAGLLQEQQPEGEGTLIVLLEDEGLVETAVRGGQTAKEFFDVTQAGQSSLVEEAQQQLLDQQQEIQQEIRGSIVPEMELGFSYTAVLNGFSMEVPDVGVRDEIAALPGVKSVTVAQDYAIPSPVEEDIRASLTELNMLSLPGYEGEGRVVAVIDSGLDTEHEFFQTEPDTVVYTKQEMEAFIKVLNQTKPLEKKITSAAWRSNKIPFAWGYAEGTENTLLSDEIALHGTHVAGIATGIQGTHPNQPGETFHGVAPQAQLVFFAIADAKNRLGNDAALASFDDVAKLGVDAVNCSFGSDYVNVLTESVQPEKLAIDVLRAGGIQVLVAAGNSNKGLKGGPVPANQVEYAAGGTTCGFSNVFTVASADGIVRFDRMMETATGERVSYYDSKRSAEFYEATKNGAMPLVYCGSGTPEELEQIQDLLPGSIAMLYLEVGFSAKDFTAAAIKAGVAGVLVWLDDPLPPDNYPPLLGLPHAYLSQGDGALLLGLSSEADGENALGQLTTVTMVPGFGKWDNPNAKEDPLSDFTSWGSNELLELKPDIAAPGGAIFSSIPDGTHQGYVGLSGTSMASPQMAGFQALLNEWFEKDSGLTEADLAARGHDRASFFKCLAMSTAEVYRQESGVPYSPRRQGAGQVNPLGITASNAFLLGESAVGSTEKAARVELGEIDEKGAFTAGFTIEVTDSTALKNYEEATVTAEFFRNDSKEEDGKVLLSGASVPLSAEYTAELGTPKGNSIPVTVQVQLDQAQLEEALATFTNGFFVDGYLTVTPAKGETVLNLPAMGFYHTWAQAPVFDHSIYTEDHFTSGTRILSTLMKDGEALHTLQGADSQGNVLNRQKFVAISPNGDSMMDTLIVDTMLLRGALIQWAMERQGVVVLKGASGQGSKFIPGMIEFPQEDLDQLPEGEYQLCATGELPYGEEGDPSRVHTFAGDTEEEELTVFIDKTAPTARIWLEEKDGKATLYGSVKDNHSVKAIQLSSKMVENPPENWTLMDADLPMVSFSLDITGYTQEPLILSMLDHAGNERQYDLDLTAVNGPFTDVSLGDWYYEAVKEVYVAGLFGGISEKLFAPQASMTRAMAVTVLHRAMGTPEPSSLTLPFTDVNPKAYYYKALCWAQEQGIAGGISPTLFDPEGILTREQLAAILYRTMGSPAVTGDLSAFPDGDTVSAYAKNAMLWATQNKIILGDQGMLLPKAFTNRAQVAVMISRLFSAIQ